MARGGARNRKPTKLKVLHGTDRADRMPANEPLPRPIAPEPPAGMDHYARQAWKRLSPILENLGLLTEADAETFTALCEAWGRYWRARGRLRQMLRDVKDWEDPVARVDAIRKAEISVEKAETSYRLLAQEFGLSPASRSRLSVEVKDDAKGVLDRLWSAQG